MCRGTSEHFFSGGLRYLMSSLWQQTSVPVGHVAASAIASFARSIYSLSITLTKWTVNFVAALPQESLGTQLKIYTNYMLK